MAISIDKVTGAKSAAAFISAAQNFYQDGNAEAIKPILISPPKIKLQLQHHIIRLGLLTWIDQNYSSELTQKIREAAESKLYSEALCGVMFLFGCGHDAAI